MLKKIIVTTLLVFTFFQTATAMIPGPPIGVDCPKCGEEKELMSLISGNTFIARQWSDGYQYTPMMPRLSPVQKCPECGYYFLLSDDNLHRAKGDGEYCSDTGRLSYDEMKQAFLQMKNDSLTKDDELSLRLEFLHRFNDAFREDFSAYEEENVGENKMVRDEADWELHRSNLNSLIALLDQTNDEQNILLIEAYREMGKFYECVSLINAYHPQYDYLNSIINQILEKVIAKDDKVIELDLK